MKNSRTGRASGPSKLIASPQGVLWRVAEESRRIGAEIIPLRPEMVVDDVEQHGEPALCAASISALKSSGRP